MTFQINSPKYGIKEVLIDDEDYDKIKKYHWYVRQSHGIFYANAQIMVNYKRTTFHIHKIIMNTKSVVDHINGNGLDNRKCNLRICTIKQNSTNLKKCKRNISGYKGVSAIAEKNSVKYIAQITYNYKNIYLGLFDTAQKAHSAYCEASKKYHGEFGRTA
jgi:hypothetical protein